MYTCTEVLLGDKWKSPDKYNKERSSPVIRLGFNINTDIRENERSRSSMVLRSP